jgi:hypothetical protein
LPPTTTEDVVDIAGKRLSEVMNTLRFSAITEAGKRVSAANKQIAQERLRGPLRSNPDYDEWLKAQYNLLGEKLNMSSINYGAKEGIKKLRSRSNAAILKTQGDRGQISKYTGARIGDTARRRLSEFFATYDLADVLKKILPRFASAEDIVSTMSKKGVNYDEALQRLSAARVIDNWRGFLRGRGESAQRQHLDIPSKESIAKYPNALNFRTGKSPIKHKTSVQINADSPNAWYIHQRVGLHPLSYGQKRIGGYELPGMIKGVGGEGAKTSNFYSNDLLDPKAYKKGRG